MREGEDRGGGGEGRNFEGNCSAHTKKPEKMEGISHKNKIKCIDAKTGLHVLSAVIEASNRNLVRTLHRLGKDAVSTWQNDRYMNINTNCNNLHSCNRWSRSIPVGETARLQSEVMK